MEIFKNFNFIDISYLVSIVLIGASALYMPWISIPITNGFNFINENAVSIVITLAIFLFALFFVDDKLSALISAAVSIFAVIYILFQFFSMGGFTMNLPMIESDNIFNFTSYGLYVFLVSSAILISLSTIIFRRNDE